MMKELGESPLLLLTFRSIIHRRHGRSEKSNRSGQMMKRQRVKQFFLFLLLLLFFQHFCGHRFAHGILQVAGFRPPQSLLLVLTRRVGSDAQIYFVQYI